MTDQRKQAADLARQILRDERDLQWLAPLAREFLALSSDERMTAAEWEALYEKEGR